MKSKETFKAICEAVAEDLQTILRYEDVAEYAYSKASFMTDRFGGVYASLHYDWKSGAVTNWYGDDEARRINGIGELLEVVKEAKEKEERERDLEAVYAAINGEYC